MGKRLRTRRMLAGLCLAASLGGTASADTASLQKGIDALNAGKAAVAVKLLSAELEAPATLPADRARALYFRAKAHLASGQAALAISDANAAIWMKRLSSAEAEDAEAVKTKAMKSAGVQPVPQAAPAATASATQPAAPPVAPVIVNPAQPVAAKLPLPAPPSPAAASAEKFMGAPLQQAKPQAAAAAAASVQPAPESAPPRQAAAAWSSAKIDRQELPQAAPAKERLPVPPFQQPVVAAVPPPPPELKPTRIDSGPAESSTMASSAPAAPATVSNVAPPPKAAPITTGSIAAASTSSAPPPVQAKAAVAAPPVAAAVVPQQPASPQPAAAVESAAETAGQGVAGLLPSVVEGVGSLVSAPVRPEIAAADELQRARTERIRAHNAALAAGKKLSE